MGATFDLSSSYLFSVSSSSVFISFRVQSVYGLNITDDTVRVPSVSLCSFRPTKTIKIILATIVLLIKIGRTEIRTHGNSMSQYGQTHHMASTTGMNDTVDTSSNPVADELCERADR